MLLGSIITIALISGLIYIIHQRSRHYASNKPKTLTKNNTFHCVETHHHGKCCEAVKALNGIRFLSSAAPILPITGCNQNHCECDYIHHDDRRYEVRRTDIGIQHDMYGQGGEVEHRGKAHHGRRITD
jgi:V8-like Glu-specific endopeptidase